MYRLLELYQQEHNPDYPLVCMDEKSKQLLEDSRKPIKAGRGKLDIIVTQVIKPLLDQNQGARRA
jgi:hypothetical protein